MIDAIPHNTEQEASSLGLGRMKLVALLAWHYFVQIEEYRDGVWQGERRKLPEPLEIAGFVVIRNKDFLLTRCPII